MKIGYARVSTVDQNEARQMEALREEGVDRIYMDKKSGKDFNRPEYQKMIVQRVDVDVMKPRKITIAELEKQFGYPIEIVS